VVALLALAACSSGDETRADSTGQADKVGDRLTVVTMIKPQTLDPAKAGQNNAWVEQLAYEPLIVRRSDGKLAPGLAASWKYEGTGNTRFVLTLRPGVTFSDGSKLTAQNVVDHFTYVTKAGGQMAGFVAGHTFTATDQTTVTVTAKTPNPSLPEMLTQDYIIGGVIGAAGLKAPSTLGTRTLGAGPYMLDEKETRTGDHYTYVPNPHYYDKAAVRWRKVVIRVIDNPQAVLNAVRTGQADVAGGDPSTVAAAEKAGLTVAGSPTLWSGVVLADRGGAMAPPLKDARVRQALNHATDRRAIVTALFDGIGEPTAQISVPDGYGHDPALESRYPYDVQKAKALLAAAGYPNGFALRIVTPQFQQLNLIAQALKPQWKQAGVDLQITDHANANQYAADAFGGKFPVLTASFSQIPIWMQGPSLLLPGAAYNPFRHADPGLQERYDRAVKAPDADRDALDREVIRYVTEQAWFVPVVATPLNYYARDTVGGVHTSARAPLLSLAEITPAS
jgi:peptide/nickel transport system substrate-binding protein